ncbi:dephospho-CoA kinase [Listeria floridensis FSL S10-1187]|uniref:Dephospho-CoA kinase n=1 Tax=Listeria floridensis FSL S10-1187 TaxID=1265817 RepID=A0ABN0RHD7_9LIST|nr:dephospho-CoA kinase [Listeria floridensis]EUJ33263.1 dephospho-CoA kinase [Listeria floridensis FSL S10-1187]
MGFTLGLTGSIATGKSTVSKMLSDAGIPIIDADVSARRAVEKGTDGLASIVDFFGSDILLPDGQLDRAKLGSIVFMNEDKREQLNRIVHPFVQQDMLNERKKCFEAGEMMVVFDIPLLFESELANMVDEVLVVWTTEEVELERLMARNNLTKAEALARIQSQIGISKKKAWADFLIDNNGTKEETKRQVDQLLQELSRRGIMKRNNGGE